MGCSILAATASSPTMARPGGIARSETTSVCAGLRSMKRDASGSGAPAKSGTVKEMRWASCTTCRSSPCFLPNIATSSWSGTWRSLRGGLSSPPATRSCGGTERRSPSGRCPKRARPLRRESATPSTLRTRKRVSGNSKVTIRCWPCRLILCSNGCRAFWSRWAAMRSSP